MESPSSIESQSGSPLEYATPEELKRAKQGAAEFRQVFTTSGFFSRVLLRHSEASQELQSMFLGLKPIADLSLTGLERTKDTPLPSRLQTVGQVIYDEESVKETIAQNPEVFEDFGQFNSDLGKYLDDLINRRHAFTFQAAPEDIKRIGLLYGFPKDAVFQFAQHSQNRAHLVIWASQSVPSVLRPDNQYSPLAQATILHFAALNEKGKPVGSDYSSPFFASHKQEVKDYLGQLFPTFGEDDLDYFVESQPAKARGFGYATGKITPETEKFPQKVEEIYERSGMNAFLKSSRFLISPPKD